MPTAALPSKIIINNSIFTLGAPVLSRSHFPARRRLLVRSPNIDADTRRDIYIFLSERAAAASFSLKRVPLPLTSRLKEIQRRKYTTLYESVELNHGAPRSAKACAKSASPDKDRLTPVREQVCRKRSSHANTPTLPRPKGGE